MKFCSIRPMKLDPRSLLLSVTSLGVAFSSVSCSSLMNRGSQAHNNDPYGAGGYGAPASQDAYGGGTQYMQQPYYGGPGGQQAPGGYAEGGYQPSQGQQPGYSYAPPPNYPGERSGGPASHVVARGDTLWGISQRYGTTVSGDPDGQQPFRGRDSSRRGSEHPLKRSRTIPYATSGCAVAFGWPRTSVFGSGRKAGKEG